MYASKESDAEYRRRPEVLAPSCLGAAVALGQFGGRPGDAVIYVVSAKGNADFVAVPPNTINTQTGFITEDPSTLFDEPFGPDFPGESRRKMHAEDGDVFNLIVEREGIESPYQFLQGPVKVLISQGLLRLYPPNEPPVDTPVGFYAPFPDTIDFGPNRPNYPGTILFWTNFPNFPVAKIAPVSVVPLPAGVLLSQHVQEPHYHQSGSWQWAVGKPILCRSRRS